MRKEFIVLSGFLGSGKTTILQGLLHHFRQRKVAVLVNDFGKIPVDGSLLASTDCMQMVEIAGGSIFCACLKASFVQALAALAETEAQMVLVEASGMSDPAGLGRLVELTGLGHAYHPPRILGLFDAVRGVKLSHVLEVIPRQVRAAHAVLLTKTDLVSEEECLNAEARIRELDDSVPVWRVTQDQIPDMLESMLPRAIPSVFGFNTPENRPDSFVISTAPCGVAALLNALRREESVLRVKGYLTDKGQCLFISDTGQGWMCQPRDEGPAVEHHAAIPLTVICMQGEGKRLEERLRERRLAE